MDRRNFLRVVGAAGAAGATGMTGSDLLAAAKEDRDQYGILVDLTRCAGCRMCELACAEANGLPDPDWSDDHSYDRKREPTDKQWSAINRYETSRGEVFVKQQCMHCLEPACAAACLTKAMLKTEEGPVVWREDKCMGCRYCMLSCPFDVPKFEYDSPVPKIQKCRMCWEKLADGGVPACVENCPNDALAFGKRSELLELARQRIYGGPGEYVSHIYGEHEAGGTGVLYISPVPFDELGFRTDLDTTSYPELTRDFLTSVPMVLILWPAMLFGIWQATRSTDSDGAVESSES
ncbi:MAG: 4Fe-4S dicluster domain-containing protein [Acidobacteriota bacterium]|nr:4Fe-4S dicluster domain-containing protein [Acidobacteriota bacterium]